MELVMGTILRTFRLDDSLLKPLAALSERLGGEAAAISKAILRLYSEEIDKPLPRAAQVHSDGLAALQEFLSEVDGIVEDLQASNQVTENVTRTVAERIAQTPAIRAKHKAAVDALGALTVNQRLGRRVKEVTGLESCEQVRAFGPAAEIISSYTRLRPTKSK